MERRISVRVETAVGVACRMPATPRQAIMHDLSLDGCRIEIDGRLSGVGSTVVLDLNQWISISGTIMWGEGRMAGVRFDKRLDLGRFGIRDWIDTAGEGLAAQLAQNKSQAA
jgi:hypothetical protein